MFAKEVSFFWKESFLKEQLRELKESRCGLIRSQAVSQFGCPKNLTCRVTSIKRGQPCKKASIKLREGSKVWKEIDLTSRCLGNEGFRIIFDCLLSMPSINIIFMKLEE